MAHDYFVTDSVLDEKLDPLAHELGQVKEATGLAPGQPTDASVALVVGTAGARARAAVRAQALDAVGARVVLTDDPSVQVPDGALVIHYQGPRSWVEDLDDGLVGMTPRLTSRDKWTSGGGAAVMPAGTATTTSPRALSIDRLGEGESSVELLGEVSTSRLIASSVSGLIVRGQGHGAKQNGFSAVLYGDGVRVFRWVGGEFRALATIGAGQVAANEKQMIRIQVGQWIEGPSERIRVKTWRSGTPEPADWQYDAGVNQQTSVTGPGWAGLYSSGQYLDLTQSWHRVAVATQGKTAVFS